VTHFTLLVLPDGRGLLTTEEDMDEDEARATRDAFNTWRESDAGIAVIASCHVEKVTSIDLDLPYHVEGMVN